MIQVHIKYKNTELFYVTRLSALDVLANLATALWAKENYLRLRPYLNAYTITQNQTVPVVRIAAYDSHLSAQDSVEVLFYAGSEHFTLGEIAERFPPSTKG